MEKRNWFGDLLSYHKEVVTVHSVDDIVRVLTDSSKYPSPVRATGSNHSTTRCAVANEGTNIDMTGMNKIVSIGSDTVTAQAGALYIDVAKELEKQGLQFYVNVELGNLSIGSAACGGTKDSSMPGEWGQVASYVAGMKLVLPSGEVLEVTEAQPDLLQIMRSSYGLLGVIFEATFRIRPLQSMAVYHETFDLEDFAQSLPAIFGKPEAIMMYLWPFDNKITIEFRKYHDRNDRAPSRFVWWARNIVWKKFSPLFAFLVTKLVPIKGFRYFILDTFGILLRFSMNYILRSPHTSPTDQIIRYPEKSGMSRYTFSIWAFPEKSFLQTLRDYFQFCRAYYRSNGYRCNMLNVGYRIAQDQQSLFSYSFHGPVVSIDPVSTGDPGWKEFLLAYNEFCSYHGGVPLFNQSYGITRDQAQKAFEGRLKTFEETRKRYDPNNRLFNHYFQELLSIENE